MNMFSRHYIRFLFGAAFLFVINYAYFLKTIVAVLPVGADTPGHFALGFYYAQHIFPSTWGWIARWFGGMPWPQFYPPFFYFLIALVYKILPFSFISVFKGTLLVLTLLIPGLLSSIAKKYSRNDYAAWVTLFVSAVFLSITYQRYGNIGVTLQSTFDVGLVTQLLAAVLLFIWMYFFLNARYSKRDYYLSLFALAGVFLSSVHVIPVAFIFFVVTAGIEHLYKRYTLKDSFKLFLAGFIPLLLTAFWSLPLLTHTHYLTGRSLGIGNGIGGSGLGLFLIRWWYVIATLVISLAIALKKKEKTIVIIMSSTLIILLPIALKFDEIFPKLPVHIYRSLPLFFLCSAISVGYLTGIISSSLPRIFMRVLVSLSVIAIFVVVFLWYLPAYSQPVLSTYSAEFDNFFTIADYMKDKEGMMTVETAGNSRYLNDLIMLKSQGNLRSDYSIFAESSPESMFMVPFKDSVSEHDEKLSVDAYLEHNGEFKQQSLDDVVARARFFGIQYFLMNSASMKDKLAGDQRFSLEKTFGAWNIYKLQDVDEQATVLRYEPAVAFVPLNFKQRSRDDIDYIRIQEGLIDRGAYDVVIAQSDDRNLDTTKDLDTFNIAIISTYSYHNETKALARLKKYAEDNTLILLPSSSDLYLKLQQLLSNNSHVVFISPDSDIMDSLFATLDAVKKPLESDLEVRSVSLTDSTITLDATSSSDHASPVLIHSSYFPDWKEKSGGTLYMATPVYTLAFIHPGMTTITFKAPESLYIGYLLSGMTLLGIMYGVSRKEAKKKRKPRSRK